VLVGVGAHPRTLASLVITNEADVVARAASWSNRNGLNFVLKSTGTVWKKTNTMDGHEHGLELETNSPTFRNAMHSMAHHARLRDTGRDTGHPRGTKALARAHGAVFRQQQQWQTHRPPLSHSIF